MTELAPPPAQQEAPLPWAGRTRRQRPPLLLLLPSLATSAVALSPLVYLVVRATSEGLDRVGDVLVRDRTVLLLLRSLVLAGVVTAACLVIGVLLAWLVVRSDLPGRRFWGVAAALPLAIPTYVAGFSWLSLSPGMTGWPGAIVILVLCCVPYVVLPVAAALRRVDPAAEEVARSLGLTPFQAFRRATLPQLRPAVAAGGLLVALYVLSDFGAVSTMRFDAFTRVIYNSYRASFDRTPAAILGLLLVAVTLVLVWLEGRSRGRAGYARVGAGDARTAAPSRLGRATAPALLLVTAFSALALGVPAWALTYWTVRGASDRLPVGEVLESAASSLSFSLLGAVATTVAAIPVGLLAARRTGALPRLLERASYAGHALPGIVVALSLVFLSVRVVPGLYQRTPVLVLAYVVLFLPLAVGSVHGSAAQSPPALEEVARATGAGPLEVLRRVTLPLAAPGIGAGAALVFLTCMKELPATLLLRPLGSDTLATRLWTETGVGAYAAAAPYAAVLVVLSAVPTYLIAVRGRS